jgi:5-methylcytosine-specific restriction endonuclease McrA
VKIKAVDWLWLASAICLSCGVWLFFRNTDPAWRTIPSEPIDQLRESTEFQEVEGPRSSRWPKVRAEFVRLNPVCAACGGGKELNVHHIEPFHRKPELELDPGNLITLCREHHFFVGHDPDGPWEPKRPNWSASNPQVRQHCERIRGGGAGLTRKFSK